MIYKTKILENDVSNADFESSNLLNKVEVQSKMYTGTVMDGDFEENIYDPADYIGMEVEYNPDLYEFILKNQIHIFNENDYKNLSEAQVFQIEVRFNEEVSYGDLGFIPVGLQSVVLNENTMLIGLWGKIILAYKT